MDVNVNRAIKAALSQYAAVADKDSTNLELALSDVFNSEAAFMEKLNSMDAAFDDHPVFEALREPFFDLLLINFFNEDVGKLEEDYLESQEWEDIEEQTIERGTELLNLLLYLQECEDEDIEPELSDFLKEFLLVDEDEFQDEHRIYEPVIANQILVDGSLEDISRISKDVPDDSELKDLFYPMFGFFREQNPDDADFEEFVKLSENPDIDSALYSLLLSFKS